MPPVVAMVLPPREGFSPDAIGAVGLVVHRLATAAGGFSPVVVGMRGENAFTDVTFRPAAPTWAPAGQTRRYAGGVARVLRQIGPALIEVHNRPELALFLAGKFPAIPV